jgi:acyl dehydratase
MNDTPPVRSKQATQTPSRRYEFPIERGKILEFARAIKSSNPAFFGRAPIMPPTFLMVGGQIWGYSWEDPGDSPLAATGVDSARSLHLEETYEFFGRPSSAGEVLEGQLVLLEPVQKVGRRSGPMTLFTTETTYWRSNGERAAVAKQVIAQLRDARHGAEDQEADQSAPNAAAEERLPDNARRFGPLKLEDVVRYQAASGDLNPHHYDAEIRSNSGFSRFFVPGMLPAGLLGGMVADITGADRIRRISFSFRELVFVGDTVTCSVDLTDDGDSDGVIELALTCARSDGKVAVTGTASVATGAS